MNGQVTIEGRLGVALPVATTTLPLWFQELLLDPSGSHASSPAAIARRKRQRFGLTSKSPTRVYASDRFIPSRRAMDMDYCSFVMETDAACPTSPSSRPASSPFSSAVPTSSRPSSSSSANRGMPSSSPSPTMSTIGNEHADQMQTRVRYQEALVANLFPDSTPSRKTKTLLQLHARENESPSSYLVSPTGVACHPSLYSTSSPSRHIPTSPTRILDAPQLRDDYYLNLVSWGDNNILAVALDRAVYLYHTDTGAIQEIKACTESNDYVTSVAWIRSTSGSELTSDSNKLAVGTFRSAVQVWDTTTATKVRSLSGHSDRIGALAWNGVTLTSGSRDGRILHHDLRMASLSTPATLLGHQQEICGLAWSPDGKTLASGGNDNCLCLWDAKMFAASSAQTLAPRQRLLQHRAAVKALAWCPWERHLLASGGGTADRTIKFWNTNTGRDLHSVHTGSQVCGLVWSKTERELLSSHGFSQNELCLWKYPSMVRLREFTGHTARVLHLAMSPDGSSVVSAAADETLRFWNVFASSKKRTPTHTPRRLLLTNPRLLGADGGIFPDAVIR